MEENEIILREDDPAALCAMIRSIYGYVYDTTGDGSCSPMRFNIKVYQIADKYGIPKLKYQAQKSFEKILQTCWSMDDFPLAIEEVYDTTPEGDRGLRDPIVDIAREHIHDLIESDSFSRVFKECTGFAENLARALIRKMDVKSPSHSRTYRCPSCQDVWIWGSLVYDHPDCCAKCSYRGGDWGRCVL